MIEHDELERIISRGFPDELRFAIARLGELPPARARDGLLARAYLALSRSTRGEERERSFLAGYSYARTSRDPVARPQAELLRAEFESWKR